MQATGAAVETAHENPALQVEQDVCWVLPLVCSPGRQRMGGSTTLGHRYPDGQLLQVDWPSREYVPGRGGEGRELNK